ncbi:uncharacterized protein rab11fip1a isoform X2 [Brienomyrus brachyistius]|nr:uncharacterized protein rab11fip1a isoform X2 [Brienomyrus brachyistius]
MFSTLHSSLAPPNAKKSSSDSLSSINENLDTESHRTSTSYKRQASFPPGQKASAEHVSSSVYSDRSQSMDAGKPKAAPRSLSSKTGATSGYLNPIAEVSDSREKESSEFQSDKRPPLPLPDYDELFPKRRHGILGQVKWDMVISEVNLKQKKNKADVDQNEMSIDEPDLNSESIQVQDEKPAVFSRMTENHDQEEPFPVWRRTPITNKQPVIPPKPKVVTPPGEIPKKAGSVMEKPNPFASRVFLTATPKVQNTDAPQAKSRILLEHETKVQNTGVDVDKGKDNSPKVMLNSTIVVGKDVVSQGDTKTPFKSSEDSLPVEPRQSSLNKAPVRNASNQETLGSTLTQKPQNEAKDTKVLEKVSGTEEIKVLSMTTDEADLFSGSIFLKTPTVTKPDLEEKAIQSPAKQLVVELDPFQNNSLLSKDLVVGKNAESQGDAKTPLKSTKEGPPVKPRQSSLNKAPIRNASNQETLGSLVTQKPQNEAKDARMLEEVSGSEEVNVVSMTTNKADLFSGSIFLKTPTVTKPDLEEKAIQSPAKQLVVEPDPFQNNSLLSKDLVVGKNAESQGDAKTPLKSTKEGPPVKPRQSSLNKALIRNASNQETLGSLVTQKPQNEAKDARMLEEVSGSEEVNVVSMTTNKADLFSGRILLKTPTVARLDLEEEEAATNSPVKEQVVELDSFPNDSFLSKDLVLVKDSESQGDTKTPLKSTKESPPVKPRQSSLIKAPITTTPVQEQLGSMLTQKPQDEAKDSKILAKMSESEEINEESTTMTKGTDLFSDSIFAKTNVLKPGCEEKAESPAKWRIVEPDPFPNDVFLSKDPWTLPLESKNKYEQRMSEEDLEKIFSSNIADPFTDFVHNVSAKSPEPKIEMTGKTNAEPSSGAQSNLFTKKKAPPVPVNAANADKITTEHLFKHKPKVTTLSTGESKMETRIQNLDSPAKRESSVFQSKKTLVAADPIPSASSPVSSSLTSRQPQMSATEEGTPQRGVTSGGKTLLRAWVTPSESQSVSVQSSSGGGAIGKMGEPASSLRRPHPVKPLGSESLISASTLQGRDGKPTETHEPVLRKPKVTASESGPYSQLTQEELITLVVKQQGEISKKDAKILELEEYIDNLLVRVIDEKPSILMSMPTSKKAF